VRVIAGKCRGMRLVAPRGFTTRPTSDRVKEALFSILSSADRLQTARVLDLCAGSGALGIEALSRGAEIAVFIEKDRAALEALRKNLAQTGLKRCSQIMAMDCQQALKHLIQQQMRFSLVLFDPPYQADLYTSVISTVGSSLMAPDGLLVAEAAERLPLPEQIGPCVRTDHRLYGDTALAFYTLEAPHAP